MLFGKLSILNLDVVATQVGPGYVELHLKSSFGSIWVVQTVTPLQPMLQKVVHMVYAPIMLAPYARLTVVGESIMFERDVRVWNYKKYLDNPLLVQEDRLIKGFRRWYKQFYTENSPTYQSCKETLKW